MGPARCSPLLSSLPSLLLVQRWHCCSSGVQSDQIALHKAHCYPLYDLAFMALGAGLNFSFVPRGYPLMLLMSGDAFAQARKMLRRSWTTWAACRTPFASASQVGAPWPVVCTLDLLPTLRVKSEGNSVAVSITSSVLL